MSSGNVRIPFTEVLKQIAHLGVYIPLVHLSSAEKNTRSCVAPNCHSCLTQTMTSTEQHSPHLGSVSGRSCLHVCLLVTLRENDCSCRHETSE